MIRRIAAAVVWAYAVGALLVGASPVAAAPRATVTVKPDITTTGQRVLVQGSGWNGVALVRITLCGNLALDGSADCDLADSVDAGVGSTGTFSMTLTIGRTPTPCPCVVRVSNTQSALPQAGAQIRVTDLPNATPHSRVPNVGELLRVDSASLSGSGPWQSWFGGAAHRTLVVTLHNVGHIVLDDPKLTIAMGKQGDPTTQYVPAPRIARLLPGERRTLHIPVTLDAFSWGTYAVTGQVIGYGQAAQFHATTSTHWWGWFVVAFILLNIFFWVWLIRATERRRQLRNREVVTAATLQLTPVGEPTEAPVSIELPDQSEPVA
jgi:hypothetical protein